MKTNFKKFIPDIVVIGAGPAGISCALNAKKNNLNVLLLDKGNIVNSIINFPKNMTFFSTPELLEIEDIPFTSNAFRPNRNEAIKYYQKIISKNNIQFISDAEVTKINKSKSGFRIDYTSKNQSLKLNSKYVIIATGFYDNPNMLNIPGEKLSHVSHYYEEPFYYFGKKVIVVGGKNSAVLTALELFRSGAEVTMVHRKSEFKESVKYWILPDILNRIHSGEINVLFNSIVKEINMDSVIIDKNGQDIKVAADAVFLLTGYHPNTKLLDNSNIIYDKDTLVPKINNHTLESNIRGIYLAGSLIAGRNSNKIFIENSRGHGVNIINHILDSL